MIAVVSLLLTLTLSLLVTRVAAMALMLTGISREMARFQARSAFSGVGYTTSESESLVNHPVRRRILMTLMLLGNLGIATVVAAVLASLIQVRDADAQWTILGVLASGLLVLWFLATNHWVERRLNRVIAFWLRRVTKLEVRDYVAVLHLQNEYAVTELRVDAQDWLANKSLAELHLPAEGVLVLGVQRAQRGHYVGAPRAETTIHADDVLILYGPIKRLEELDVRRKGRRGYTAHRIAVEEQTETEQVDDGVELPATEQEVAEDVA